MTIDAYMWIIWLSVFVIALVIEALDTDLISLWFSGGAIISLILSFIEGVAWWIEIIVFAVVSCALLLCLRPIVKRYLNRDVVSANIESIIHKKGELTDGIDLLHSGVVLIGDVSWTAIAEKEDEVIEKGSIVEVLAVSGNKLIVRPYKPIENKEGK
ncbi:MAG: NfeD family protein [Bacillota bacterium]|nr:NfeD family protein [Bacillota bacterium]